MIKWADKAMLRFIEIRHRVEGAKFTRFRSLAISDMEHGKTIIKVGDGCCYATVHTPAGKDDGKGFVCFLYILVRGHFCVIGHQFSIALPLFRLTHRRLSASHYP